jgi:hypothetical protein
MARLNNWRKVMSKKIETEPTQEIGTCSICGKGYHRWGNNAWPVNDGRCCDDCNAMEVIPARIARMYRVKEIE